MSDGPVRVLLVDDDDLMRAGLKAVLSSDDAIEVGPVDGSAPPRRMAAGQLGRVLELVAAPDGRSLAVATHDGRVLVVDVAAGEVREVARTGHDDASGLVFSPDSAWLAWSHPGAEGLSQIRAARVDEADAVLACYRWLFAPPGAVPPTWNPQSARIALIDTIDADKSTVIVAVELD